MKTFALATITAFTFATAASAAELGNTGISLNAEGEVYYDFDAEDFAATLTPSLGYSFGVIDLTAETEFNLRDIEFTGIEWTAEYELNTNASIFGRISSDADFDFSGVQAGLSFSF
jgi:opacity protein-like surface antigen